MGLLEEFIMSIEIREVLNESDRKKFVNFPFELYKNNKNWAPPVKADELKALKKESNPAFDFCDARFWLAYKDNKIVGRVGGIINKEYNKKVNDLFGRINRLEFIDDKEVSSLLIKTLIEWFKKEGLKKIHGPLGFSNLDTQGMLIEGFEYLQSIASVYHLPYYKEHMEALGFEKENDWVEFRLSLTEFPVKKAARGAALIKKRYGFESVNFKDKAEMQQYSKAIFDILNEAFHELPYVTKFNDKMINLYIEKYFKILNHKYVKVVKKDDELVGFVIGLPSLSEAMQKAKGKLFPLGFYHIMKALKKPKVIDLLLTGVKEEYQSAGVAVILFAELQQEILDTGLNTMETTGIFETNHNVIANWKNYESIQHKRRRCFVKEL